MRVAGVAGLLAHLVSVLADSAGDPAEEPARYADPLDPAGPRYGFGSSGSPSRSTREHRETIRVFLAQIDPATGYIGDS